jgi:tight adherence protein B
MGGAGSGSDELMLYAGLALVGVGVFAVVYLLGAARDTPVHESWKRYVTQLDAQCRLLFLKTSGEQIAKRQAAAIGVLALAALLLEEPLLVTVAAAIAVGPRFWLSGRVDQRRRKLEDQLDQFLTTLANALRASPSLGDAIATTASLMRSPLRDDLDFALKENRLGAPLDQALLDMSKRIGSRTFSSALTTILIGRQTGGDLAKILEKSAGTLREMARLEGVVRSKTAEGRAQAWVLGAVPFLILLALNSLDPNWLVPLTTTFIGYLISGGAILLWLGGILAARKILNVDV